MGLYQCDVRYDRNGFRNDLDLDSAEMIVKVTRAHSG
jgi:hypothetical protein